MIRARRAIYYPPPPACRVRDIERQAAEQSRRCRWPVLTMEEIERFVDAAPWKFARTMPHIPHWYCLLEKVEDKLTFCRFARHIRQFGYKKPFGRRIQTYFDVREHRYWVMDADVGDVVLINRAVNE